MSWRRRAAAAILTTALAAVGAVGIAAPAHAATPTVINLLTINDFHGRINAGTVDFAKTVEKLRQDSLIANGGVDNTLLVGAGDLVGASEFASAVQKDQPTIDVMNALDMAVSSVGNHEFDQGFSDLTDRIIAGGNNADWDYIGANVYLAGTQTPALPEYGIYSVNGITVGVVGVVTQETPTLVSPAGVATLDFGDPVAAINRVTDELTDGDPANGESDIVIATMHEGAPIGTAGGGTLENQLASSPVFNALVTQTSPKVAALIQAHTHQAYAWDAPVPGVPGKTRPIIQTGNYAANVGQIQLTVDADTNSVLSYTVGNMPTRTGVTFDPTLGVPASIPAITTIVNDALAYAAQVGSSVIGSVSADVTTAFAGGTYGPTGYGGATAVRDNRGAESTLGNKVADALLDSLAAADRGGAELSLVNPGGLRAELLYAPDGSITYAEANGVLPFINNLWTTSLTGQQIIDVLEQQWQTDATGAVPSRSYLQLGTSSNVSYTYVPDPDGDGILVGDLGDQGKHISAVTIAGAPLDLAHSYRVGTFSFLTQGGDNFRAFTAGSDARDSGLIDRDAWIAYLTANSPVAPSYAKHAVAVSGLDTTPDAGSTLAFQVGNLDLTSLGSPANTGLTVSLAAGASLGSAAVVNGSAAVSVALPTGVTGAQTLLLTAAPSGTVVRIPITITPVLTPSTVFATVAGVQYGTAAKVKVKVTASGTTPTGPVTVSEGGAVLGTATLSGGTATITLGRTALQPGVHSLAVTYPGTAAIAPSQATVSLTITKASSVTLALSTTPIVKVGAAAKVTAITLANGLVPVGGTTTVYAKGVAVGTATVTNGVAKLTLAPFTSTGLKVLTVTYGGSATVASSSGIALVLVR